MVLRWRLVLLLFSTHVSAECCENSRDVGQCIDDQDDLFLEKEVGTRTAKVKEELVSMQVKLDEATSLKPGIYDTDAKIREYFDRFEGNLTEFDKNFKKYEAEEPMSIKSKVDDFFRNSKDWSNIKQFLDNYGNQQGKDINTQIAAIQDRIPKIELQFRAAEQAIREFHDNIHAIMPVWIQFGKMFATDTILRDRICTPYPGFQKFRKNEYYFIHRQTLDTDEYMANIIKILDKNYHLARYTKDTFKNLLTPETILPYFRDYCARFGPQSTVLDKVSDEFLSWMSSLPNADLKIEWWSRGLGIGTLEHPKQSKRYYILQAKAISSGSSCRNAHNMFRYISDDTLVTDVMKPDGDPFIEDGCERVCLALVWNRKLRRITKEVFRCFELNHGWPGLKNAILPVCKMKIPDICFEGVQN